MAVPGGSTPLNPLFQVIAFGAGTAMAPVLRPAIQDLEYLAWNAAPVRVPAATLLAQGVAQGQVDPAKARQWARDTGFADDRWAALVDIANVGPGTAYAFELWRRGLIGEAGFRRAVKRLGLEQEWIDDLVGLFQVLLTPDQLAAARVKGHITQARQYSESALQGIDNERAEILYQTTGNPPGPETLEQMFNRGIIDGAKFTQGILQGNIRPEWRDELFALRERLLTPAEIVNLRLRGWHDDAWMYAHAAELGLTQERTHDLYLGQGRPISFRQVFIGERRGGTYDGPTGGIDPAFLKSLQESNIRPEWYNLAFAQRESLPSAFVIRALLQGGAITPARGEELFLRIGWPADLAKTVADFYGQATAGTDPLVKSEQRKVLTRIANAYQQQRATDAEARGWMTGLNVAAATQDELLAVWNVGRQVPGAPLTRSQIKKAFKSLPTEWTRDRALAELEALGLEPDEAQTLLDE